MENIIKLETLLHQHEVKTNSKKLDELLHLEFQEIGLTGKCYTKEEVLKTLTSQKSSPKIHTEDFSIVHVYSTVTLLTYKSANIEENGTLSRFALRSSLWKKSSDRWQILFHQATMTEKDKITLYTD